MRVVVRYGRSVSLKNVAEDIVDVLRSRGIEAVAARYVTLGSVVTSRFTHIINVTCVDPLFTSDVALVMWSAERRGLARCLWYATIEGEPREELLRERHHGELMYVANSGFTKRILERHGLRIADVVPHGVSPTKVESALALREGIREQLRRTLGDRVVFTVVASGHRRKGWDAFLASWRAVDREVRRGSVVLYVSTPEVEARIARLGLGREMVKLFDMGTAQHWKVLGYIAASDFLIHPSLCEGFGLPALEAAAVGTPVIAGRYEPLTEFLPPETLWVPIRRVEHYEEQQPRTSSLRFILHVYEPEDMARRIEEAFYLRVNERDRYEELRETFMRRAEGFYTDRVYSWFVSWVREGW